MARSSRRAEPEQAVRREALRGMQERLGYTFANLDLLDQALTHRSHAHENPELRVGDNERLEFLGDAVLNLAVASVLMEGFPQAPEGELSALRSRLVNQRALAEAAAGFGMGDALRLGEGERKGQGRLKPSILAGAYEAVLGAIYQDGGFEAAARLVHAHCAERLGTAQARYRDFKSELQERCQREFKRLPRYRLRAQWGPDHRKVFEVELKVSDQLSVRGTGPSRKEAEQRAAEQALLLLGEAPPPVVSRARRVKEGAAQGREEARATREEGRATREEGRAAREEGRGTEGAGGKGSAGRAGEEGGGKEPRAAGRKGAGPGDGEQDG